MFQSTDITKIKGLGTQYNPLDVAPGVLIRADDCYIRRENIAEDRRGYSIYATLSSSVLKYFYYNSRIIAQQGSTISYDNGSGTFSNYSGTYSAPTSYKSRFVEANQNLYITTNKGVQVFTDLAGTAARNAGSPRSLDASYTLDAASTGFLSANSQCAYRSIIQRTDANGNVINGYPSTRLWVSNPNIAATGNTHSNTTLDSVTPFSSIINGMSVTGAGIPAGTTVVSGGGTASLTLSQAATATATGVSLTFSAARNIDLTLYLPSECIAGDVVQFYRTTQQSGTSTDATGDEMGLIYQYTLTSTDISNGFITFTDSIVDSLIGATIYTAPSQEGISQGNDRPPLCNDMALFKQMLFYANTSTKQRLYLTMVGTSALSGNTITLGGVTYNFGSSEKTSGAGSPQALISTTGVASVDIDLTARSLVRVINRYASNTSVYAYYLSGPSDLPGQILIEEKGVGASAFTVQSSNTSIQADFYPPPPVSPATNSKSTSSNQVNKNGLYYSKVQQLEHVPTGNYLLIGAANKAILRIAPLRDSIIVIKEEGVWRVTGDQPSNLLAVPLDLTVFCKSYDSVATLSNTVFMLSNQGIVQITETGVAVVSHDIENKIQPLLTYSGISSYTSAFSYETERSYFISTMTTSTDTAPTQTFVYNIITKAWVRHSYAFTEGIVEPSSDKFFIAKQSDTKVYRERKDFQDTDFADPETAITITAVAVDGSTVDFTISGATPDVGWVVSQLGTGIAISSVSATATGYHATLSSTAPSGWAAGAATIYPPVGMWIEWAPFHAGKPGSLKQISHVEMLGNPDPSYNSVTAMSITFRTNFDENPEEVVITRSGQGWGSGPWGTMPWGGGGDSYGYPSGTPKNKQYCRTLIVGVRHKYAQERFSCCGVTFFYEGVSDRIGK